MHTGMMWHDADPKIFLAEKILKAVDYYSKKYNHIPNTCVVHPSMTGDVPEGIRLETRRWILPNHLWLGVGSD